MSFIADGLLIATCLTAAVYCFVLSKRLKQFTNTEDGVGKQVRDLNRALEETRAALKESQSAASGAMEALSAEIAQSKKMMVQLRNLTSELQTNQPVTPIVAAGGEPPSKLEAVKHPDVPSDLDDEDETDDIEEIDLEQVLNATPGEQQLGFLPEDDTPNEEMPHSDASPAVADAPPADSAPELPSAASSPQSDGGENLLKVERMAL